MQMLGLSATPLSPLFLAAFSAQFKFPDMTQPVVMGFFAIGMALGILMIHWLLKRSEDELPILENNGYLTDVVNECADRIRASYRYYQGALIMTYSLSALGSMSGHAFFGSKMVHMMTYGLGFVACLLQLIKDRKIELYLFNLLRKTKNLDIGGCSEIAATLDQLRGFGFLTAIFFRVVVLSWLFYSALHLCFTQLSYKPSPGLWILFQACCLAILWWLGCQQRFRFFKNQLLLKAT